MTQIGVVGLGYWGSKVVEEYIALREEGIINKVIACDTDHNKLTDANGADEQYNNITDTLESVDGVHLCTPIGTHETIGKQVLQKEVDLLIEKPFTDDSDAAFALLQLALKKDCVIQTGHIFRFANVINHLREIYQAGKFGELQTVTLRWTHNVDFPKKTDVLWDLAPHPIDIMNYVTEDWPSDEYCRIRTQSGADGPVSATAQFRLAETHVMMQLSWDDSIRRRYIELSGTKASAVIEAVDQEITIYDGNSPQHVSVESNNTIRREAKNFIEAIQTRHNLQNSGVVGVRTVEAIERLRTSNL